MRKQGDNAEKGVIT